MQASYGKYYKTDCLDTKGVLRLVQSIPSPKAEPFKMWLTQVGSERLDEIADPEKAILRGADFYRAKGYTEGKKRFICFGNAFAGRGKLDESELRTGEKQL